MGPIYLLISISENLNPLKPIVTSVLLLLWLSNVKITHMQALPPPLKVILGITSQSLYEQDTIEFASKYIRRMHGHESAEGLEMQESAHYCKVCEDTVLLTSDYSETPRC